MPQLGGVTDAMFLMSLVSVQVLRSERKTIPHFIVRVSFIFCLLLINNLILQCETSVTFVDKYCPDRSDEYTMQHTVDSLLQNISIVALKRKFHSSSADSNSGKIYALFHCREDLELPVCDECIRDAMVKLAVKCTNSSEAVAWYYECMLRYSNRSVFPLDNKTPFISVQERLVNYSNPNQFDQLLSNTLELLISKATDRKSSSHFAVQEVESNWYTLAQCIPLISGSDCKRCLQIATANMHQCCSALQYGMVFLPSCQLRYANNPFYMLQNGTHLQSWKIAVIVVLLTIGVGILVSCSIFIRAHQIKGNMKQKVDTDHNKIVETLKFRFSVIKAATKNFSVDNILGKGGFGEVYKGKLETGQDVAVKRLSRNSDQGLLEFKNEVLLVAKLQHRNLVKLLGFCEVAKEKILIYEFLCNSSLDKFLYDPKTRVSLNWETRFKIITGIARGLMYLHEDSRLKIIHRDLKPSNILLDEEMNPKISDFGIAKHVELNQVQGDTSRIIGTYGYMAPEYSMEGNFSEKSDIYSFGIMVLEIISGLRNNVQQKLVEQHEEGLLHRAWRLWNEGRMSDFVDSVLGDDFSSEEVKTAHHIGLLCIQVDAAKRPGMIPIVTALNGNSISLPLPTQPHFFTVVVDDATCTNYYSLEVEGGLQPNGLSDCVDVASTSG